MFCVAHVQVCHQEDYAARIQVTYFNFTLPFEQSQHCLLDGYLLMNKFFKSFSQYLENYLWVNYTPQVSSNAYIMSICCIVNEKFRENVPAWEVKAD